MSSIGPSLPPHLLAKRKRQAEENEAAAKKTPDLPKGSPARSPDGAEKRRRTMGPAAPPAPIEQMPSRPADAEDDSDSSDDDFGPSMPTGDEAKTTHEDEAPAAVVKSQEPRQEPAMKRDDWMTLPPSADGLRNMDPTKLRPGKFRSGKGATSSGGGGMDSTWTETPEEKRKRLADQVMGVAPPPPSGKKSSAEVKSKHDEESAKRIKEYNEKHRGQSLYDQHNNREGAEKEDDPSKRAFDREKDIGGGIRLDRGQKKELMNRAANFGNKFSGGKYL